jgi:hypothetical protein
MGTYYDPQKVKQIGRNVTTLYGQPTVQSGNRLIGVLEGLTREIAPDLTDPNEYKHFYENYAQGWWLNFQVFIVPESKLDKIRQ